jgi:hypothetical protein
MLLAGITWGIVNSAHTDEVERNAAVHNKQWEQLKELNDSAIRQEAELKNLRRDVDELRENRTIGPRR